MASLPLALAGLQGNEKRLKMVTTTKMRKRLSIEKLIIEQLDHQIRKLDNGNRMIHTMSNSIHDPGSKQSTINSTFQYKQLALGKAVDRVLRVSI